MDMRREWKLYICVENGRYRYVWWRMEGIDMCRERKVYICVENGRYICAENGRYRFV